MTIEVLTQKENKPRFERSIETQLIIDRLLKATLESEETKFITYKELSEIVGYDIQESRSRLTTARNNVEKDHNMVFNVTDNIGIYLMDDVEVAKSLRSDTEKARRSALRGIKRGNTVDYFELPEEVKVEYNTSQTLLHLTYHTNKVRAFKKLRERVLVEGNKLNLIPTLDHFAGKKGEDDTES